MSGRRRQRKPGRRNAIAASLRSPWFKMKRVKAKRGKGAYRRKPKHGSAENGG